MDKKSDDVRSFDQIKAYPRGSAQGGRAIQAVKGFMSEDDGAEGHRTVVRETAEGRAIARTRHYQPMVEVEKQGTEIGVDHGVLDSLTIAPLNPDAYKNGKLWRTPLVTTHVVSASPADPDRPIVDEIEPPDSVKGVAPVDGADAKSLRANAKGDNRDGLFAKKFMMGRCPPSIFTGRTRLWVQAMYGRHDDLGLCQLDISLPSATPAITVSNNSVPFRISTNTGVYLDPATGEHWCIDVGSSTVSIYPMACSSDAIEELRTWLTDPTFPPEDKERVEAYILSDSLPVRSKIQTLSFTFTSSYSMGYGWHFNWNGDRCDIVINDTVAASGGGQENISTHYRLTFTKNEKKVWSVSRSIVEGPTRWKSLRHVHPITEPTWDDMVLTKFGAHLGPLPYGNAPFYAFYARNDLKVCRYAATTTAHTKEGVTREPSYYNPNTYTTIGSDALNYRTRDAWTGSVTSLSCGGVSVSFESGSYTENAVIRSSPDSGNVREKVRFGPTPGYFTEADDFPSGQPASWSMSTITDEYWGTISVFGGGGESGWSNQSYGPFPTMRSDFGNLVCRANTEQFVSSKTQITQFIAVVPFYDAEAIYLYGQQDTTAHEVGVSKIDSASWFGFNGVWESNDTGVIYGQAGTPSGDQYAAENVTSIDRTSTNSSSTGKLICRAGTFDAAFPGKSGFWSAADSVAQHYPTQSSSSGSSVIASSNAVSVNNPASTATNTYVGWA